MRSALRADLVAAMRSRQPDAVAALRTALAAIDNAEAVEVPDGASGAADGPVAGAHIGVGSTEAERRVLSSGQVRALLRAEVEERDADADRYDAHGQHGAAERLRRQADALRPHVDG